MAESLLQRISGANRTPRASSRKQIVEDDANLRKSFANANAPTSPLHTVRKESRRPSQTPRLTNNAEEEDAIFNSIDPRYNTKDFDPIANILQKVSVDFSKERLESEFNQLDITKAVIDKRLSTAVMKNYGSFVQGMQHIHDVKMDLAMTDVHCTNGRRSLARAEKGLIHTLMQILSRHRKKTRLMKLYSITIAIKRLVGKEKLMETLLDYGQYPAAVITHNECVAKLKGMNAFHCLNEMSLRFEKNRETMRERFNQKLMGLCINFESNSFQNIIRAYVLLDEGTALGVILRQCFINALEDAAKQALTKHIAVTPPTLESLQFSALCRMVELKQFKACFLDVCSSICQLLYSSHSMILALSNVESFSVLPGIDENISNDIENTEQRSKKENTQDESEAKAQQNESLTEEEKEKQDQEKDEREQQEKELNKKKKHRAKINEVMRKHHKIFESLPKVGQELKEALNQIWNKCQDKLSSLLKSAKLTTLNINIEEFLQILNAGYKLISIGERLTGTTDTGPNDLPSSPELAFGRNDIRSSLLEKSTEYVAIFHRETFETLRATFESEMWRCLPLPPTFALKEIKELRGSLDSKEVDLEEDEEEEHLWEVVCEDVLQIRALPDHSSEQLGILYPQTKIMGTQENSWVKHAKGWSMRANENRVFLKSLTSEEEVANKRMDGFEEVYKTFIAGGNPFLSQIRLGGASEITTKKSNNNGEKNEPQRQQTPIQHQRTITSASLSTVRRMGRYIHIMRDISPLAVEALKGLREIFDFYLYSIFNLFGIASAQFYTNDFNQYPRLKEAVNSVKDRILCGTFAGGVFKEFSIPHDRTDGTQPLPSLKAEERRGFFGRKRTVSKISNSVGNDIPAAPQLVQLHRTIDLNDADTLSGTVERCVATESIMLLVEVLKRTKNWISSLLPSTERYRVKDLVNYCSAVVVEFQSYVYRNLAPLVLPFEQIDQTLEKASWDLKELQSDTNSYVETLLTAMKTSNRTIIARDGLPDYVMKKIWSETVEYSTEQLVVGYSKIRKCTTAGRALMTQDLNVLKKEIGRLTQLDPLPSWGYVTNYVEGFYMPEKDFLEWMSKHPNYSVEQYISIAQSGPGASMKNKERKAFVDKVREKFERIQKKIEYGDFSGLSSDCNDKNDNEDITSMAITTTTSTTTQTFES